MKRLAHLFDAYLYYFLLALVLIMPLHAFLAISLGNITGHQAIWQTWKEVGLVLGGIAASGLVIWHQHIRRQLIKQPAVWATVAFGLIALLVSTVTRDVPFASFLLGAKTTLAFLVLFIVVQTIRFSPQRWRTLIQALLTVSSVVGLFAVAQVYLLPADFLTRFGYGTATVLPFHLVDPAVTAIRIIATFSGPNQLGSFMVIPFTMSLWLVLRRRWIALAPLGLTGFSLFHSYSRSAWIGAVIAMFVVFFIRLSGWWKLTLLAPIAAILIAVNILSGPVHAMTTNLTFYVYHGQFVDGHTNGSDSHRLKNAQAGLATIQKQPAGYGLGTAGPASKDTANPIITENSYLQIGIEAGVVGLLLFGLVVLLTLKALYAQRLVIDEATPLFAALIGLSVTNLFLHTWADSATALVLWGLIGYCLTAPTKAVKQ